MYYHATISVRCSLAVHEFSLPKKALEVMQGGGAGRSFCMDDWMAVGEGRPVLRQKNKEVDFFIM